MDQSDRRRFDASLITVLQTTMQLRSIPDSMLAGYWDVAKAHPLQPVLEALTRCLRECDRGQCTPAYLLRTVLALQATTAREKIDQAHLKGDVFDEPNTPFNLMRRLARLAYSRKVVGADWRTVPPHPRGVERYTGDFDYMPSVDASPVPTQTNLGSHRKGWREFNAILEHEWDIFNGINKLGDTP